MLFSIPDVLLKLFKTSSPQKLFNYYCITLYPMPERSFLPGVRCPCAISIKHDKTFTNPIIKPQRFTSWYVFHVTDRFYMPVRHEGGLSVRLSVCLCPSICLYVRLSVCMSVYLSVCQSICSLHQTKETFAHGMSFL